MQSCLPAPRAAREQRILSADPPILHALRAPRLLRAITLLLALSPLACAHPRAPAPADPARPSAPSITPAPSAAPDPPWHLAVQLPALHAATKRAASQHFTGDLDGEVLVNDAARAYPALGPTRGVAPGATLVERHLARDTDAVEVYLAMVKREPGYDPAGGDWEYLVVLPDGRIEDRGRLALCARCHAEAPHDHLFGSAR